MIIIIQYGPSTLQYQIFPVQTSQQTPKTAGYTYNPLMHTAPWLLRMRTDRYNLTFRQQQHFTELQASEYYGVEDGISHMSA